VIAKGLELSAVIEAGLVRLKETCVIAHVRGEGCVWGIECADIGGKASGDVANDVIRACYEGNADGQAIHLLGALAGNVIRISPPLTMNVEECQHYLNVMFDICQSLTE